MNGDSALRALVAVVGSVLSLALISAVLSPRANTSQVIGASAQGLEGLISAATAPITSGGGSGGGFGGGLIINPSSLLGAFSSFMPSLGQ